MASNPPDEKPVLAVKPLPIPVKTAPHIATSIISSLGILIAISDVSLTNNGEIIAPTIELIAKSFPRNIAPRIKPNTAIINIVIDFKRFKDDIPATVKAIEYDPNRTANIALLVYADGQKAHILQYL